MATSVLSTKEKKNEIDEDRQPGVVYIGHVPHGFFEKQLRSYFSQFGVVMSVKLSRSMKTGKSKGYAFVKFRYAAVAKTVAETCHNYLFFNKLLKCEYKPLSEVHEDTFFSYKWRANNKQKRQHNRAKSEEKLEESLQRSARRKQGKLNKLKDLGIDLKLEDVMNVPERPKRKPKPRIEAKEKAADVENMASPGSAEPSLPQKTLRRATNTSSKGIKRKKAKSPGSPKALKTVPKTPSSNVKGRKPKLAAPAQPLKIKASSAGVKESIVNLSKKSAKVPSAGVKGRKTKPPPAKRAKKE